MEGTPPGDTLPPPPQRATPARKGARCEAGAGSTRPHRPHPGHAGHGTLAARSGGRAAGGGTAPDTRRPSQRWKAPPPGTPFRHPHSEQHRPARAHAVGPVLGPHARIDRTRDTRVAEPWLHAPEDERPGEGQRLTPGAPHDGGRHPPRGRPSATPTASSVGPQGRTLWGRCWVRCPHRPRPGHAGRGTWLHAPEDEWPREGQCLTPDAPHNGGRQPPPGTPFRHPHSEQRRPARAHAVGPVLGPHAHIDRARDTRAAEPWLRAPEGERPGKGQRLTPGAPHNGGKRPPRGRHSASPTASSVGPQGRTLWDRRWVHTPASTAPGTHGSRNPGCTLRRASAAGGGTAPDTGRPSQRWKAPPRERPSATPTASNAGPQGRTLWGRCRAPTPTPTAPGTRGSRNPGCTLRRTGSRGRDSAWHQAPLTTVEDSPPRGRPSATPTASNAGPQGRTLWGRCWVRCPHRPHPGHAGRGTWLHAPEDERPGKGQRLTPGAPHNGGKRPPPGTPFRQPHSEQRRPARAHAVGPVLGPHARIDRARDTRVAEPWLHATEGERGRGRDSA